MIVRTIGLAALGLALAADAIMIPSTVTLPGLTAETLDRQGDTPSSDDSDLAQTLPMPSDLIEKLKDLHIGVSKPFPFLVQDDEPAYDDDEDEYDEDEYDEDEYDDDVFFYPDSDRVDHQPPAAQQTTYDDDEDVITIFLDDSWVLDSDMPDEASQLAHFGDEHGVADDCPAGSSPEAIFCRIRAVVSSKFDEVKPYFTKHHRPCPKKLASMQGSTGMPGKIPISGGPAKFWQYFKDKADGAISFDDGSVFFADNEGGNVGQYVGHRHHHHHADGGRFMRILHGICAGVRTFVTSFLIPILIGVVAGMTASLVGMCVGTILAWLWIKFVRGGKRGNARAVLVEEVQIENGEKDGLLTVDVDAPPDYVEKVQL